MPVRYYKYDKPFVLENGERLSELQIAYHTYGKFKGNNAIWVCHALTANSDVADWWPRDRRAGALSRSASVLCRMRERHRVALRLDGAR